MAMNTVWGDYQIPSDIIAPGALSTAKSVSLTETKDLRKEDPCHVMKKIRQGGGPSLGAYMSDRPVADILHQAASQAFEIAGNAKSPGRAELNLCLKIQSLDFNVLVGFAQGMLKCVIQVQAVFTDASSGKVVWEGICEGAGRTGTGDLVKSAFTSALKDFIQNLSACPGFK